MLIKHSLVELGSIKEVEVDKKSFHLGSRIHKEKLFRVLIKIYKANNLRDFCNQEIILCHLKISEKR